MKWRPYQSNVDVRRGGSTAKVCTVQVHDHLLRKLWVSNAWCAPRHDGGKGLTWEPALSYGVEHWISWKLLASEAPERLSSPLERLSSCGRMYGLSNVLRYHTGMIFFYLNLRMGGWTLCGLWQMSDVIKNTPLVKAMKAILTLHMTWIGPYGSQRFAKGNLMTPVICLQLFASLINVVITLILALSYNEIMFWMMNIDGTMTKNDA